MAEINGHEYVDLGLPSGVLWSKFDYGSSSETSAGGTYTWYSGIEKYNPDISNSNFDGRTVLELQDDIVNKNWGGNWCIPTKEQFKELIKYCSISGSDSTNKNYREYSRQGNSIKFPERFSRYWSNELKDQQYVYILCNDYDYDDGDYDWDEYVTNFSKDNSCRIRPVWVPSLQHTVNVYDENETLIYTETVNRGDLFTYKPTKDNCLFLGYIDESNKLYTEQFSVNSDLNLTVKWYFNSTEISDTHEYVDLGLPSGIKWATYNMGALVPEAFGELYKYGETTPNIINSSWANYKWNNGSQCNLTKYCTDNYYGTIDNKTILELIDDAAYTNWGTNWRSPSLNDFKELINNCTWIYKKVNNVFGYLIIGPNNNSIFLPHEKGKHYLTNTLGRYDPAFEVLYAKEKEFVITETYYRHSSAYIRPVYTNNTITITYNSNDNSETQITEKYNYGDLIKIQINPFTTNNILTGWNTEIDGSGTTYLENSEFSIQFNLNLYAQWIEYSFTGSDNNHDYVDLGLPSGTLWATKNIGANTIMDSGNPFAWGETEIKNEYNSNNYKWFRPNSKFLIKYNIDESSGIVDNKINLDLEDDVAHIQWGGNWTLPTTVFVRELKENCIVEQFDTYIKLTSKINNNYIYFTKIGTYTHYLTSNKDSHYIQNYSFYVDSSINTTTGYIYDKQFARPIIKQPKNCNIIYKDENTILNTISVPYGDNYLITQENPSKDGYLFRDWLLNNSSVSYKAILNVNSDIELMANWVKAINITLINQNDEIAKIITVSELDSIKLPSILGNTGYYCYEYNTQKDGSGDIYNLRIYPSNYKFTEDIILYAQYKELKTDYVDFDLPSKTLWAKYNIGATSETEPDGQNPLYFWFGDPLETINRSFEKDYKYGNSTNTYTKYTLNDQNYNGSWYDENQNFIGDGKSIMDKEDDPAYTYLGGNWRTPTKEQWEELLKYCILDTSSNPDKIISKKDSSKFIYLPFTFSHYTSGYEYLLNTLDNTQQMYVYNSWYNNPELETYSRNSSYPIRPVMIPYSITYKNGNFEFIEYNIEFTIKNPDWVDSKKYITSFNTEPDGSGTTYNIGDVVTLEEDLTLYAQWKDKPILYIVPEEGKTLTVYCEPGESVTLEKSYWDKYHNCIGFTTQKDSTNVEYKVGDSITINEDTTLYAVWEDLTNGVEFIDLKLPSGNLWAKNNIEGHYAWSEIETKSAYDTTNYKYSLSNWDDLTKYNCSSNYCKDGGEVDYKKSLELSDDIANIQLKGDWHIPTKEDWEELLTLCDWEYTDKGMKITYKDSTDFIFLPACGDRIGDYNYNTDSGFYWTKDLNSKLSAEAFALLFKDNDFHEIISESRFSGLSVRPVMKLINDIPEEPEQPEQPEEPETPDFPEEIPETGEILNQTIGTYNVRYWNGENDSNNQGEIAWPNRRNKVFEFLMNEGIWGVQEVTSAMYPDFINKEGYAYIGYGRDNGLLNEKAAGEQIGIFYNTSKYQILNQGSFFYKNTRSVFNRLCVWAKVQNLINGTKFFIFNNHLAHDSEEARLNQLNTLLSKIPEIAGEEKVFILGDFNFTPDSEEYQVITDIYEDSVHAQEVVGPQNTYNGLYSTTDTTEKRVDYIYSNFNEIIKYKVDNDNKGLEKYPSDHYPVVITFNT